VNRVTLPGLLIAILSAGGAADQATAPNPPAATTVAAGDQAEKPPSPWSNSTELSLVVTEGNSHTTSFGLKDTLEHKKDEARWRFRIDTLRTTKNDDAYLLIEPGLTFQPGETPTPSPRHAVRPASEPDIERYFTEGRYDHNISKVATWNAGASWDRNEDAGILNRYIVFAGVGHVWRDREDLAFRTSYGLSWTDREEEILDPEKEQRFPGARLSSDFKDKWGASTTYDNDFTFNISFEDFSDYNVDLIQGVSVSMSKHLSLKVSLQFLYANEPALEEVDVIARVNLIDPDGIPGNGDEFFETVDSGGTEITIGEDSLRKEELDSTFRASLLISF
jgi:putative salt-induced outer membrane protein YdiY